MKRAVSILLAVVFLMTYGAALADDENPRKVIAEQVRDFSKGILQVLDTMYRSDPNSFDVELAEMVYEYYYFYDVAKDIVGIESNNDLKGNPFSGGKGIREQIIMNADMAELDTLLDNVLADEWMKLRKGEKTVREFLDILFAMIEGGVLTYGESTK